MEKIDVLRYDLNNQSDWLKYKRIWWFYLESTKTRFVPRVGRVHNFANDDFSSEQMLRKPEDVSEHQNTTTILWNTIITMFPDLFDLSQAFYTSFLASIHDLSEGISGRDCADNGSIEHEMSRSEERIQMDSALSLLSKDAYETLSRLYLEFENPTESENEMVVTLKMVDKLDAILGLLADEKRGIVGTISIFSIEVSERDLRRADYLGTRLVPDNWMLGLRKLLKKTCLRPVVQDIILGVAWVAFMDLYEDPNNEYRFNAISGRPDVFNGVPYCLTADLSAVD